MLLVLENGMIMQCYDSDNCLYEDDTDSCEGYCLFNADGTYNEGGEFDFNSDKIKTERTLLNKVVEFAVGQKMKYSVLANTSDCAYEDFNELLEEEFSSKLQLMNLMKKLDNEHIKAKIRKSLPNMRY